MISAGFAGALNPALGRNDLALPEEVIDPEGRRFPVARPESLGASVRHSTGRLLTVDRLILGAAEKTELHATFGPTWSTWKPRRSPPSAPRGWCGSWPCAWSATTRGPTCRARWRR